MPKKMNERQGAPRPRPDHHQEFSGLMSRTTPQGRLHLKHRRKERPIGLRVIPLRGMASTLIAKDEEKAATVPEKARAEPRASTKVIVGRGKMAGGGMMADSEQNW